MFGSSHPLGSVHRSEGRWPSGCQSSHRRVVVDADLGLRRWLRAAQKAVGGVSGGWFPATVCSRGGNVEVAPSVWWSSGISVRWCLVLGAQVARPESLRTDKAWRYGTPSLNISVVFRNLSLFDVGLSHCSPLAVTSTVPSPRHYLHWALSVFVAPCVRLHRWATTGALSRLTRCRLGRGFVFCQVGGASNR